MCNAIVFLRGTYELYVVAAAAAGFTPLRLVELGNCYLSTALDGAFIPSDHFGVARLHAATGKPRTAADADLERRNLQHSCEDMVGYLDGQEAFGFRITATTVPEPGAFSAFCEVDEKGISEYLESSGGCGCATGCVVSRCRSCAGQNRPCTWRCKCKGRCSNNTRSPLPERWNEIKTLPLAQIVMRLTPRDIEFFAAKHGRFQHYFTQFALCPEDEAASCWYCSRFGARSLPTEMRGKFLPLGTVPNAAGDDWKRLPERWADVLSGAACAKAYATDDSLPSNILAQAYRAAPTASPPAATVARLAKLTLLADDDIRTIFKQTHAKAVAKAVVDHSSSSDDDDDAERGGAGPSHAAKRPREDATSRAPLPVAPLKAGELVGRKVVIPCAQWADEDCDELDGEGWRAVVNSESRGVAGIKIAGFIYHFPVPDVLKWRPLR